jgi:small subunit ribosomal protein S13
VRDAPKNPTEPAAATPAAAEPAAAAPPEKAGRREKTGKSKEPKEGKEGKEGKGKTPKGGAPPAKSRRPIPDNPNFRYIVRLAGSDLDGQRPAALALTGVTGVGLRIAQTACRLANVDAREMLGNLPEATAEHLETVLNDLPTQLPAWMLNHPIDRAGEHHHYLGGDLETARRDDVNVLKMVRSYRGVRHERGQKVRGQRTRSNGRTGMAAGVLKKAAKEAAAAKSKEAEAPKAAPTPEKTEKKE